MLDVPVYDHVIVGGDRYVSFAEAGLLMTSTVPMLAPELARAVAAQRDRLDLRFAGARLPLQRPGASWAKRALGRRFLTHSVAVATLLADLQMDSTTIAAALLHDVVEDSDVPLAQIRTDFGNEVADLVDGLTKSRR